MSARLHYIWSLILAALVLSGGGVATAASPMSASAQYDINKMNSIASKWQLGTLIQDALTPSGSQALPNGQILLGQALGTALAVTLSGDISVASNGAVSLRPGLYQEVTGTLTQAQLISMFTTPITLVPAPGAGLLIVPIEFSLQHVYSTAAYTGGGVISLKWHGSTTMVAAAATIVTGSSTASYLIRPSLFDLDNSTGTGTGLVTTALPNLGLDVTNATAVFAAGNVANVLNYRIKYRTIAVP